MPAHEWHALPTGGFAAIAPGSRTLCSVRPYRHTTTGRTQWRTCYRGVVYYSASWSELTARLDVLIRRFEGMDLL